MVEQSTAASHSLASEAGALTQLLTRFKTGGGHAAHGGNQFGRTGTVARSHISGVRMQGAAS
jgi:methyl-accepting chemotaxis protein